MASAETIDLTGLMAPIEGDNPAGMSLRYDGVYDAIQDARRADADLPMGDWQRDIKAADWRSVVDLSSDALKNKSKDLQVAIWLTEALVKMHGFAGLRDGFRLLKELQENFWEGLYPEIEDGDLEFRAGPLEWLNQKLPDTMREIALTRGDDEYNWNHWEESQTVENLGRQNPEAMQAALADGKISSEQFNKAVDSTPRAFYENLAEDLIQCAEELSQLEQVVDGRFGAHGPSLLGIRKALHDCRDLISRVVKTKRQQDPSYKPESNGDLVDVQAEGFNTSISMGAASGKKSDWSSEPRSREEAFQRLAIIANYLRRIEPQHPVSYLLERAVRWTQMPLEDWLNEVVQNDEVLARLRDTLGIKP